MKNLGVDSYCQSPGDWGNVYVGNYSSIADECFFHHADNHRCINNKKLVYTGGPGDYSKGIIKIGNDVLISKGVKILSGITIGDGAIIGAWAVIAKNIPPYAVVVGNPQVIKRYRFNKNQIKRLLKIKWWDWLPEKIVQAREDMEDINIFLEKYDN